MCEQCTADTIFFGSPLPGWFLVRATRDGWFMKKDDWGLVRSNDPDFYWQATPLPDPYKGFTDEEVNASKILDKDFLKAYEEFWPKLEGSALAGYKLVRACEQMGYEEKVHGSVEWWLFDFLGRYLQNLNS